MGRSAAPWSAHGSFRNQIFRVGRPSLTDDDINTIAETVVNRMLDAPSGTTIVIRHSKGTFTALLGGVPRPGDILWLPLRQTASRSDEG